MAAMPLFSPVIVMPTYRNSAMLPGVLARVDALQVAAIVVNDGSHPDHSISDSTASILQSWRQTKGSSRRDLITFEKNRGKAAALQAGFQRAQILGFTHAVTLDTDGQLDPADIPPMLEVARQNPDDLILGCRDQSNPDYPSRSKAGRAWSVSMIRIETGRLLSDSQCGLRVYPLEMISQLRCGSSRFGFETEVVTRALWAGRKCIEVPVSCKYFPPESRVSHYRPWVDSTRIGFLHARLVFESVLHRRLAGSASDGMPRTRVLPQFGASAPLNPGPPFQGKVRRPTGS